MKLSVIVCTRNRAHAIIPCLDSIAQSIAHAAPVDAEIVVVDNGSADNTSALVTQWAAVSAFPTRLVLEPRTGLSKARNCGLRAALGDLIIFTDDDCRLDKDHISAALRHDAADKEELVLRGGRIELGDPGDLPITIKTDAKVTRWHKNMRSARHGDLVNCFYGCNVMMRKALVERLGPYDERFGAGTELLSAEDGDYIYRAYHAGIALEYVPDMVVHHHHGRKSASDGYNIFRVYMIAKGALYAKHFFKDPDLCRVAYWDLKNAVREIISGKNNFLPDINFSYKKIVAYNMLGVLRYCTVAMKKAS